MPKKLIYGHQWVVVQYMTATIVINAKVPAMGAKQIQKHIAPVECNVQPIVLTGYSHPVECND